MKNALFLLMFPILISSCQENDTPLEIIEVDAHLVKVMTRTDCQSNILVEEQDVTINIYSINTKFDFSERELIETLSPNVEGNYSTDLEFGNYYCEVIKPDGTEVLNGIFELPEDFDENGYLVLIKGRKRGGIYERLKNNDIGELIPNATIIHRNEITGEKYTIQSNETGRICIEVNPGRYYIEVTHDAYQTYTSGEGLNVFYMGMDETNNFFLRQ